MHLTRNIWIGGIAVIAFAILCWFMISTNESVTAPVLQPAHTSPTVEIDGQTVAVTIADTNATREKGLGGRTGLTDHEGMLFVFPQDGYFSFWMKDMSFSIDMVWISASGEVVYIEPDVAPSTYPTAYQPTKPARYVIELPAGFTEHYGIKIGDKVTLPSSI